MPSSTSFAWQGQQRVRVSSPAGTCEGTVAVGMGDRAACYEASDGNLKCTGGVYTSNFGPGFSNAGVSGVDQVLLSMTTNTSTGNGMCVHQVDGEVRCLGDANSHGEFGVGNTSPSTSFEAWLSPFAYAIATGTWDQICALNGANTVVCAGYGFGSTPVQQGSSGGHTSVWIDPAGAVHLDDPHVFRASDLRTDCVVGPSGLLCAGVSFGTPGQVVSGGLVDSLPGSVAPPVCAGPNPIMQPVCWLESSGDVSCEGCDDSNSYVEVHPFAGWYAVALALNGYGQAMCIVTADGALHCTGTNSNGFSVPDQPPGSVSLGCP